MAAAATPVGAATPATTATGAGKLFAATRAVVPASAITDVTPFLTKEFDASHELHITLGYFGADIPDSTAQQVVLIWKEIFEAAALVATHDLTIDFPGTFALYGKDHNIVVATGACTSAFYDAVTKANEKTREECPDIPPSDFPFSPHISFGEGTVLPPRIAPFKVELDRVVFFGEQYRERDAFTIPRTDG